MGCSPGFDLDSAGTNCVIDCRMPVAGTGYVVGTDSLTTDGSTYSMTCATGYSGTAISITCTADGTWSSSSGCAIVDCRTPVASTGYTIGSGATTYGASRTMSCASGYAGSPPSITCQSSGSWSTQSGCSAAIVSISSPTIGVGNLLQYVSSFPLNYRISYYYTLRAASGGGWQEIWVIKDSRQSGNYGVFGQRVNGCWLYPGTASLCCGLDYGSLTNQVQGTNIDGTTWNTCTASTSDWTALTLNRRTLIANECIGREMRFYIDGVRRYTLT
jgi:hypothetical protein